LAQGKGPLREAAAHAQSAYHLGTVEEALKYEQSWGKGKGCGVVAVDARKRASMIDRVSAASPDRVLEAAARTESSRRDPSEAEAAAATDQRSRVDASVAQINSGHLR
jgi:hypothetical protein